MMRARWAFKAGGSLAIAVGIAAGAATPLPVRAQQPTPTSMPQPVRATAPERRPDAVAGLELFEARCAECHGQVGRGFGSATADLPAAPPSFADPEFMRASTPAGAFAVVTDGRLERGMPPWSSELTAQERWDAIYGLWSFYYTPERLARGRAAWDDSCAECHRDAPAAVSRWPYGTRAEGLLESSQNDLLAAYRGAGEAHAGPGQAEVGTSVVEQALDYARSTTYEPLPFGELTVDGAITGTIANATDPSLGVDGAYVRLVPFAGIVPGGSVTTTVDATGIYTFTDLVAGPQISYRLVASYGGADSFRPDEIEIPSGSTARADIDVYEPSTSEELVVRAGHIVVSPEPDLGVARVMEMWVLANDGRRTLVAPEGGSTFGFTLPAAARNLGVDDPALRSRAMVDGGRLLFDMPIAPGAYDVVITYELPYRGTQMPFERVLDLPAESLQLMVVGDGAEIESEQLGPSERAVMGDQTITRAVAEDFGSATTLTAAISGLPESSGAAESGAQAVLGPTPEPPIDMKALTAAVLAIAATGVLAAMAYPAAAGRRGSAGRRARLAREYDVLVARISDLDDQLAAGKVAVTHHHEERATLMGRAMAVRRRLDDDRGASS